MDRDTGTAANGLTRPAVLWINYDTLWFSAAPPETMIGASANNPDNQQRRTPYQLHSNPSSAVPKTRWLPRDSQTGEKRRWIPPKDARQKPSSNYDAGYDPRAYSGGWYPDRYSDVCYNTIGVTNETHQNWVLSENGYRNRYDVTEYEKPGIVPSSVNQYRGYTPSRHGERSRREHAVGMQGVRLFDKQSHNPNRYTDVDYPGRVVGHFPQERIDRQAYGASNKEKISVKNYENCGIVLGNINKSNDQRNDRRSSEDRYRSEMSPHNPMRVNRPPPFSPETELSDYQHRKRHDLYSDPMPNYPMNRSRYPDHVPNAESLDQLLNQKTGKKSGYVRSMIRNTQERLASAGTNIVNDEVARDIYPPKSPLRVSGKTSEEFSYPSTYRSQNRLRQNVSSEKHANDSEQETSNQRPQNASVSENLSGRKRDSFINDEAIDLRNSTTRVPFGSVAASPHKPLEHIDTEFTENPERKPPLGAVSSKRHGSLPDSYSGRFSIKDVTESDKDYVDENHPDNSKKSGLNSETNTSSHFKNSVGRHQNELGQNASEINPSMHEQFNEQEDQICSRTEPERDPGIFSSVSVSDVRISESATTNTTCPSSSQIPNSDVDHTLEGPDHSKHDQDGVVDVNNGAGTNLCSAESNPLPRDSPRADNPISLVNQQQEECRDGALLCGYLHSTDSDAEIARCLFETLDWSAETDADSTDSGPELQLEDPPEAEPQRDRTVRGLTDRELALLTSSKLQKVPLTAKCEICWDPYKVGDGIRYLICAHYFHLACIDQWLKRTATCPVCRTELSDLFLPDVVLSHIGRRRRRCIIL